MSVRLVQHAVTRHARRIRLGIAGLGCSAIVLLPAAATAQQAPDTWEVHLAPLYLWASGMSGEVSVNDVITPVFMSFSDTAKKLTGIFTFHVEARKDRWGVVADLGYVNLSTGASFTVPGLLPGAPTRVVSGDADLSNIAFEAGGTYRVAPDRNLSVIGGLRTYTMAPTISFTAGSTRTPVDGSRTAVYGFGGLLFRPKLSDTWTLVTRGDVGGGSGFTWSATAAFQFDFSRHGGILFGYRALGVNAGNAAQPTTLPATAGQAGVDYQMTHYGPLVALNLRWGGR